MLHKKLKIEENLNGCCLKNSEVQIKKKIKVLK